MTTRFSSLLFILAAALPAAHAGDADVQIISQGGVTVTMQDIDLFMQRVPAERRSGFIQSSARIDHMVLGILRNKQLARLAVEDKLDKDPATQAEIAFAANEILARKRLEAFEAQLKVPPLDVAAKEEYAVHKKSYLASREVEVQQVLIENSHRLDIEAKALVDDLHKKALANPAGFDQLVEKYSDDPAKGENHGHYKDATSSKYVPQFIAAANALQKPGEISPVFQTEYGYHFFKLIHDSTGGQLPFEAVKDKIVAKLRKDYIDEQRKAFMAKLDAEKANVNPEVATLIHARYPAPDATAPTGAARN